MLQFDGGDLFGAKLEEPFKIGQIFYQNGTIFGDSGFNGDFALSIDLDITGLDDDPDSFSYFFNILNTDNTTGDPVRDFATWVCRRAELLLALGGSPLP